MSELIGVSFVEQPPAGIPRLDIRDEYCRFVGRARQGAFYIPSENISCPLARFYLGIGRTDREKLARILVRWGDAADRSAGRAFLEEGICLDRCSPYLVYFPYPHSELTPSVLIMIGSADEIQGAIQKICARTGERINSLLSGIGAACGECTAYPLVTGQANLSVGCNGSRPGIGLKRGELLLAIPFNSIKNFPLRAEV